ncbi:MAG: hypothetical protein HC813_03630, partial [Planctomycetes bacterium]|nr:hypothetical protein [Planctomycetota bacterium]
MAELGVAILVNGGEPSSGSDVLNFNGTGGDVTVNLENSTILETGMGLVTFTGIETLNVDAMGGNITVVGT